MKKLEDYVTSVPIEQDLDTLSNPTLDCEQWRSAVNDRVMNVVVKYLIHYLEIKKRDMFDVRQEVAGVLRTKTLKMYEMDPNGGIQYDACYDSLKPGNDSFGIQCASDLRRTAAIFKEIAFNDRFSDGGTFVGLDLGSGTGILMLAMAVAAKRREIRDWLVVGMEKSRISVDQSNKALGEILGHGHVKVLFGDIVREPLSRLFNEPIHHWVSETISLNAPKLDMDRKDFGLSTGQLRVRRIEYSTDPFVEALRNSMNELPEFCSSVESGRTAMFPDIINGLYKPDLGRSTLLLETSVLKKPVILERTAEEFEGYEDFRLFDKRWRSPSEMEKAAMESDL